MSDRYLDWESRANNVTLPRRSSSPRPATCSRKLEPAAAADSARAARQIQRANNVPFFSTSGSKYQNVRRHSVHVHCALFIVRNTMSRQCEGLGWAGLRGRGRGAEGEGKHRGGEGREANTYVHVHAYARARFLPVPAYLGVSWKISGVRVLTQARPSISLRVETQT